MCRGDCTAFWLQQVLWKSHSCATTHKGSSVLVFSLVPQPTIQKKSLKLLPVSLQCMGAPNPKEGWLENLSQTKQLLLLKHLFHDSAYEPLGHLLNCNSIIAHIQRIYQVSLTKKTTQLTSLVITSTRSLAFCVYRNAITWRFMYNHTLLQNKCPSQHHQPQPRPPTTSINSSGRLRETTGSNKPAPSSVCSSVASATQQWFGALNKKHTLSKHITKTSFQRKQSETRSLLPRVSWKRGEDIENMISWQMGKQHTWGARSVHPGYWSHQYWMNFLRMPVNPSCN